MRREELEHIIAAAANVTGEDAFVVIGSQSILGTFPDAPEPLLLSMDADIYPPGAPEKADDIDGALGEGSHFQLTFGYYAHGVGPETAKAPSGWKQRLVRAEVPPRPDSARRLVALCLELHDAVLAKCVAGRDRDWEFATEALKAGLVDSDELLDRIAGLPIDEPHRAHVQSTLQGIIATLS